jgi:hypothetical protein
MGRLAAPFLLVQSSGATGHGVRGGEDIGRRGWRLPRPLPPSPSFVQF